MADHSGAASKDRSLININDEEDVRYWSQKFGVEPAQLREAAGTVGLLSSDIEEFLINVKQSI